MPNKKIIIYSGEIFSNTWAYMYFITSWTRGSVYSRYPNTWLDYKICISQLWDTLWSKTRHMHAPSLRYMCGQTLRLMYGYTLRYIWHIYWPTLRYISDQLEAHEWSTLRHIDGPTLRCICCETSSLMHGYTPRLIYRQTLR